MDEASLPLLETNPLLCFHLKPEKKGARPFIFILCDLVDLVACLQNYYCL